MYIQYTVDPTACMPLWVYFSMHVYEVHTLLLHPPGPWCTWRCCSLVSSNSLYLIRLAGSGPLRVRRTVVDVLCMYMCMHTLRSTQPHFFHLYVRRFVSLSQTIILIGSHHTYVHVPMMQRNTGRPVWPVCEYVFLCALERYDDYTYTIIRIPQTYTRVCIVCTHSCPSMSPSLTPQHSMSFCLSIYGQPLNNKGHRFPVSWISRIYITRTTHLCMHILFAIPRGIYNFYHIPPVEKEV